MCVLLASIKSVGAAKRKMIHRPEKKRKKYRGKEKEKEKATRVRAHTRTHARTLAAHNLC